MAQTTKERQIRREIDESFRPLFERYEADPSNAEGVPMAQLSERLLESSTLPRMRINAMLRRADADANNRITYGEFVVEMTRADDDTRRRMGIGKRFINRAVLTAVPGHRPRTVDSPDTFSPWGEQAEMESFSDAYDCRPPPIFIPLITAAEIAVFLYYALEPASRAKWPVTASSGCPMDSPLLYHPKKRWEAWRFLSYMLLHNGYIHLIFNCLVQLILGVLLELVHKLWRVGPVYLLGVVAGSLASSCFDPRIALVGASGGCYALIGAHFANVLLNWEEMQHDWLKNPVSFFGSGVFRLIVLLLLAGGDTGLAVYNRFFIDTRSQTSFAAHGGGFVAGLLIGVPLLRNIDVKQWERVMFWIFLVLYVLLMTAGIMFNIFCGNEGVDLCYGPPRPTPNSLLQFATRPPPVR
ncbi:hypothetical protein BOX15_Mlig030849g3 [Macrostomum lignano]|uniref:EF-hand domain-containing protein n=1 Tax=Macrostomum lignano TaxID=282301 RepID=A0A267H1J9_9PLAT|nr:hypothetical protein BOX15_Mlig030849g3 [Macrostomum lignano]